MSGVLIDQKDSRFCAGIVQNWQRITQSAQRTRKNSVMVRAFQETSIIFLLSLLHETNADLRLHRQHQASLLHRPLHQLWNPRLHIRPKGSPHEIHGWWKKSLRGAGSRLSPIWEPPPPPPSALSAQISATTKRGCRPWAGSLLGTRKQGSRPFAAPFPHQRKRNRMGDWRSATPCVTFRLVVAPLRGPGRSPVLPFACCVGSLLSVGRCGRCSCWCRFRVRGAQ